VFCTDLRGFGDKGTRGGGDGAGFWERAHGVCMEHWGLALGWSSWRWRGRTDRGCVGAVGGVRGEAGRKTPTFCKIAVCFLGVLKEPLEKSLRGALRRVSKAWTHCTQWGARFLRSAAWSRPVHLGSRQVSTVPEGPREQVVSPPSCSHNRDPKGSFGRGWSAGGGFPRGRTSYLMEPTLLPVGTTTNTTSPPTESQAAGERASGTGSAPEGGMCPHCWATPPL